MGNYTILGGFENPRRGRQARNLTTNVPKILHLKSSSEQIFSNNCRWVPLPKTFVPYRIDCGPFPHGCKNLQLIHHQFITLE